MIGYQVGDVVIGIEEESRIAATQTYSYAVYINGVQLFSGAKEAAIFQFKTGVVQELADEIQPLLTKKLGIVPYPIGTKPTIWHTFHIDLKKGFAVVSTTSIDGKNIVFTASKWIERFEINGKKYRYADASLFKGYRSLLQHMHSLALNELKANV